MARELVHDSEDVVNLLGDRGRCGGVDVDSGLATIGARHLKVFGVVGESGLAWVGENCEMNLDHPRAISKPKFPTKRGLLHGHDGCLLMSPAKSRPQQ